MSPIGSTHSPVIPIAAPFDLTDYPELAGISAITGTGLVARTGTGTYATRTIAVPAAGITISNAGGVAGNPTLALANDLAALEALSSTGIAVRSTTDTWVQRTITGTTNQVNVSNGDGVSGNPILSTPQNIHTAATPTFAGITLSGMTSGSVLFAGTGGVVSQDNSNLYWDDTNNRLGIGTASPNNPLEIIQGDLNGSQLRLANTRAGGNRYVIGVGDTASNSAIVQPGALFIYDIAAATTRYTLQSNGYFGFGTSAPIDPFSIVANISSAEVAGIKNTHTSGYSGIRMYNLSGVEQSAFGYGNATVPNVGLRGKAYFYTASGIDFAFINNTTVNITLKSSGNLLIGTTTETASAGLIQLATGTTAASGILWGTDTNLYRSAANTLKTDDSLIVAVGINTVDISPVDTVNGYLALNGGTAAGGKGILRAFAKNVFAWGDPYLRGKSDVAFGWTSSTDAYTGAIDTSLNRTAAGEVGIGTGASAIGGSIKLVNITATGVIQTSDTTTSTSSTTGALIVSGGVGIAKALYVANDLVVTPTASANRAVTITGSNGGNPTISVSAGSLAITPATVFASTITTIGGATFHTTSTALTNGAGAGAGTLTNAPAAGDPTKWIGINDNGTTRYIPAW